MKIALIGHGKMGKMIEECARARGDKIVACFTKDHPPSSMLKAADVCIDFTEPSAVIGTLEKIAPYKKPVVIGTTGWELDEALPFAEEMGILYAPNFSLGVALFKRLLKNAGELFASYHVSGIEMHHEEKKDAPSGTAKALSEIVPDLEFQSIRFGSNIGTHQVTFEGKDDAIELTHRAKTRAGFANGALDVAKWLIGKVGFHTLDDYIEEILPCKEPIPL